MKNAEGWDANTNLPSSSWVSDPVKALPALLGRRWACWLGEQLCLCDLGLRLGTQHPLTLLIGAGGTGCSHGWTQTLDGPLHPTCPKALCSPKLHCNYYWPNSSLPPLKLCMTDMDHYAPGKDFSPLSLSVNSAQGVNGLFLLLCYPCLSYGISTNYCPFYFLSLLQFNFNF